MGRADAGSGVSLELIKASTIMGLGTTVFVFLYGVTFEERRVSLIELIRALLFGFLAESAGRREATSALVDLVYARWTELTSVCVFPCRVPDTA